AELATTEAPAEGGSEAPQQRQNLFVASTSVPHAPQRTFAGACGVVSPPPPTLESRAGSEAMTHFRRILSSMGNVKPAKLQKSIASSLGRNISGSLTFACWQPA